MAKRVFSLLLCCLVIISCLATPAKAIGNDTDLSDVVDFFDWVIGQGRYQLNGFLSLFDDDVCPASTDTHNRHNFVEKRTQVNGKTGLYYICEYCGKSAGEVGQQSYNDYVGTLPLTGYNSSGSLIWQSRFSNLLDPTIYIGSYASKFDNLTSNNAGDGFVCSQSYNKSNISAIRLKVTITDFPVSGSYRIVESCAFVASIVNSSGVSSVTGCYESGTFTHRDSTSTPNFYSPILYVTYSDVTFVSFAGYCPVFEVIPDAAVDGSLYNINTRPTTITGGNYGIVGDNGQITTVVDNSSIINEVNNTYYNPATGHTGTINNWTYDYSDRSYNVTLDSGDTVTVTYGDQNITIIEGGVTYIIYYIIDGGCVDPDDPDPDPSDKPHEHSWQQTGRTEPTCTAPGQIQYTCERCGMTQVEVIPATGHRWQVKESVKTSYDDDGNLIQQGYTIYECSVCGEQYKDADGTGPPGSSGDDFDDGGLTGWLNSLIKYLSDNLSGAVELILSFFRRIPELFGVFLDFLSAMFPYLPDDIIFLLTFGIAAVVFVGIIKAIRR